MCSNILHAYLEYIVMKGAIVIFFLSIVSVLPISKMYSQETLLSLNMEQRTIKEVLTTIEKQSEYVFFFSDEIRPDLETRVSIRVKDQAIAGVLSFLFASVDLSYAVKGRQINIFRKEPAPAGEETGDPPPPEIILYSGTVFDPAGEVLPGVNIRIDGYSAGITTDSVGFFTLYAREGVVAEFSYIGFVSKKVKLRKDYPSIIILPEDEKTINEIVVIGYGSIRKKDLTGSVASIRLAEIKDVPVMSVDRALQGRVAGVDILSTTGEPGAKTSIRIRGSRSITATNEPLLVVDGVMGGDRHV